MSNKISADVVACLLLAGGITACSSTSPKSPITPSTTQAKTATKPATEIPSAQGQSSLDALRHGEAANTPTESALKEIFFEFDQYDLSRDARASLKAAADWLKKNSTVRVEVEGHCDERGTNEYNLLWALNARRPPRIISKRWESPPGGCRPPVTAKKSRFAESIVRAAGRRIAATGSLP